MAPQAEGFFDGGSAEAKRAAQMAASLSVPSLTRVWQILLKGLIEVRDATRPIAALEMALIRVSYAAELPPTEKLVRELLDPAICRYGSAQRGTPASSGGGTRALIVLRGSGPARAAATIPSPKAHPSSRGWKTLSR